jgi:hypothetical protein
MLKRIGPSKSKIEHMILKSFGYLYKQLIFVACAAAIFGLIGSSLLFLFPTSDTNITREIVKSMIAKYDNLDSDQKDQIRVIFRDIFLGE